MKTFIGFFDNKAGISLISYKYNISNDLKNDYFIGIGTALFYDPLICKTINSGIKDYLETNKLKNIKKLTGSLKI